MFLNYIPSTPSEAILLAVPVFTLLVGLGYFFMPRTLLSHIGLEAVPSRPEAIGEGRATFAGFLVGSGLICLLLQEPAYQQPGLTLALASAWILAAGGKIVHIGIDRARSKSVFLRLILAGLAGAIALYYAEPVRSSFEIPATQGNWYVFLVAIATCLWGLMALATPSMALKLIRLQTKAGADTSIGEMRGTLAGFCLAIGGIWLIAPGPFTGLMLAACWASTAFGRMISMLSDRGNTFYNWAALILELVLASLPLALVFNYIS